MNAISESTENNDANGGNFWEMIVQFYLDTILCMLALHFILANSTIFDVC